MGNAVLQELFGPLSNDLNALADLATAVALLLQSVLIGLLLSRCVTIAI